MKKSILKLKNKKGFTILELLLYIGIVSIMIMAISGFIQMIFFARVKNQTIAEVEQQGMQVTQAITQAVRNASAINSPVVGASGSTLSIATYSGAKNPTLFDLSGSILQTKEGAGAYIPLTSSRVLVSGLSFRNLSLAGTPGTVQVQFTVTHVNAGNKNEFNYSKTFYATANIRK